MRNMTKGKDINFTEGNIIESLVVFSLPIMAGEMLQNLYNSVDSLVVGNYVGDTALAAVGICSILSNMLIGFFNGTSIGSNVVISRAIGKGDLEKVRAAIRYTFTFAVVLGFALSIFGIVLSPILLQVTPKGASVLQTASELPLESRV